MGKILGLIDLLPNPAAHSEVTGIYGAHVATNTWTEAMIKFGSFDEYHIYVWNSDYDNVVYLLKKWCLINENFKKVSVFRFKELPEKLQEFSYIAFHCPQQLERLRDLAYLRGAFSNNWFPVTAVHHSISYGNQLRNLSQVLLSGVDTGDMLVCTSTASEILIEKMLAKINQNLDQSYDIQLNNYLPLKMIPLGVDCNNTYYPKDRAKARTLLKIPNDGVIFLWWGRLSSVDKADLTVLIRSFSRVVSKISGPLYLVIAGEDRHSYSNYLEKLCAAFEIEDKVIIRTNIPNGLSGFLYSAADIFISPVDNIQETLGLTVIEAMASGIPVIASDWNGYKDLIEDGKTGFLIPTYWAEHAESVSKFAPFEGTRWGENHLHLAQSVVIDEEKLIEYMIVLANDQELRQSFGERSRKRAKKIFDWPIIIRQYEKMWNELNLNKDNKSIKKSVYEFSYFSFFSHYPTKIISNDSIISRKEQKVSYNLIYFLNTNLKNSISIEIVNKVYQKVERKTSIKQLIRELEGVESYKVKHSIMWLIKHGYFQVKMA